MSFLEKSEIKKLNLFRTPVVIPAVCAAFLDFR